MEFVWQGLLMAETELALICLEMGEASFLFSFVLYFILLITYPVQGSLGRTSSLLLRNGK